MRPKRITGKAVVLIGMSLALAVALMPGSALAAGNIYPDSPVVATEGTASASKLISPVGSAACDQVTIARITEYTVDTNPVNTHGAFVAESRGSCASSGSAVAVTAFENHIHVVIGGVDTVVKDCNNLLVCISNEIPFDVPPGTVISVLGHSWWDVPSGAAWNAATPNACTIVSATRVACASDASLVV